MNVGLGVLPGAPALPGAVPSPPRGAEGLHTTRRQGGLHRATVSRDCRDHLQVRVRVLWGRAPAAVPEPQRSDDLMRLAQHRGSGARVAWGHVLSYCFVAVSVSRDEVRVPRGSSVCACCGPVGGAFWSASLPPRGPRSRISWPLPVVGCGRDGVQARGLGTDPAVFASWRCALLAWQ